MSAWLLPDHIADVLPAEARHIEELRRDLLDTARGYGYELVMPPLVEYLGSLLTGTGQALNLQTFKLVDQLSGRTLGLRADTTPQVARIDAHLLNREGVTRLCYCGPVVHTRPAGPHATREPLQFGAEIYGHAGPEADLEALQLALDCLRSAGLPDCIFDLADVRIVTALLQGCDLGAGPAGDAGAEAAANSRRDELLAALAAKDVPGLQSLTRGFPEASRQGLLALPRLYGDLSVLDEAARTLPALPAITEALAALRWLASHLEGTRLGFDLADLRGYAYYSGVRFAAYSAGGSDAVLRGGRYDEVGAVFGRKRPAVGFSLDLKALVGAVPERARRAAIRAPWGEARVLREVIARLRAQGETVVCVLPGHEREIDEFHCDRELAEVNGQWVVRAI